MMAKVFPTIDITEIDTESPVTTALLQKFWDRQESLVSSPIDVRWIEATRSASGYFEIARARVYIPQAVGTSSGTQVTLVVVFEGKNSDGSSTGNIRIKLGSGGTPQVTTIIAGDSTYQRKTVTIPVADVNAAKGTEAELIVEMERSAGTGSVSCRNVYGGASRLERA